MGLLAGRARPDNTGLTVQQNGSPLAVNPQAGIVSTWPFSPGLSSYWPIYGHPVGERVEIKRMFDFHFCRQRKERRRSPAGCAILDAIRHSLDQLPHFTRSLKTKVPHVASHDGNGPPAQHHPRSLDDPHPGRLTQPEHGQVLPAVVPDGSHPGKEAVFGCSGLSAFSVSRRATQPHPLWVVRLRSRCRGFGSQSSRASPTATMRDPFTKTVPFSTGGPPDPSINRAPRSA